MARPGGNPLFSKGNQLAKTNGAGRPTAYAEALDVKWHQHVWQGSQDVDALIAKIKSRKYSGRDMAALKLLQGDKYIIGKFMDKLVPDLHEVTGTLNLAIEISEVIANKRKLQNTVDGELSETQNPV